ncbi:MAG: hypothetical protein ACXWE6_13985 [Nitrososphaeraceae archaeon]
MRILYSNKIISTTILTALLIITGFIIIQPLQVQGQKEIATNIPDPIKVTKCQVVNPPTDPIDMNTVIFKDIAKTIHVEKEIFKCITKNGAPVVAMVSLFTELFENLRTQSTLNKTVETVTCVKGYNGTVSYCNSNQIPISREYPFAVSCDPLNLRILNIASPIEMETVVSSNGISKTVEAEKEAFLCTYKQNKPTQILDVMLFTEIFEKVSSGTVIKKNVESISCLKDIGTAKVLKCYTKKHM